MGTKLIGKLKLENGQTVFITSLVRPMEAPLCANVERLRSARILDAAGNPIKRPACSLSVPSRTQMQATERRSGP